MAVSDIVRKEYGGDIGARSLVESAMLGVDYSLLVMSIVSKCDVLLMTSTCLHE